MKIAEFEITPIAMADPPLRAASGLHAPFALRTVVELRTDSHVAGVGEIPGNPQTVLALEHAREWLLGADPCNLNGIDGVIDACFKESPDWAGQGGAAAQHRAVEYVRSAVEVACLDIIGKDTGMRVANLLGGAVRDRIPFAAYLFFKHEGAGGTLGMATDPSATGWAGARQAEALDPAGIVDQARAMCAEFGFQSLKLKGGVLPPETEVATIHALRETFGPKTPLRIDPNAVWSIETATRWGRELEGVLEYYEDPVRGQESMAEVRKAVSLPLATNMCTTAFSHLPSSLALGSEDIILCDHHSWGGLRRSVVLAQVCRTFGRGVSMHSNSHLGISLAAMAHLGAAIPNLAYDADTHYPWQSEEIITRGRLRFEDGCLQLPEGPGLGVELDREALEKLHQNYLRCGLTERNDEIEMQKVDPEWHFQATRW